MKTIYVVEGKTGEHDDYREWPVRAFADEKAARVLRNALNAIARRYGCQDNVCSLLSDEVTDCELVLRASGDKNARIDYTGIKYSVYELDFVS